MLRLFVVLPLRRVVLLVAMALLLLATGLIVRRVVPLPSGSTSSQTPGPALIVPVFRPDEPAPSFTLHGLDGSEWTETAWEDRPFTLVFWAEWCTECPDVIAHVNRVHRLSAFKDRVFAAAVNVADPPQEVGTAIAGHEWDGPVLLDVDGSVALAYGIGHIPGIVVVDEYGIVRERLFGPVSADVYEARLQSVVPPHPGEGGDS